MSKIELDGHCHCGRVRWTCSTRPEHLTRCNCSLCRRTGAVWAHRDPADVRLAYDPDDVIRYAHGDKSLDTVSCAHCGNTTHWEARDKSINRIALNTTMCDPAQVADLPVRLFDGADSWTYLD